MHKLKKAWIEASEQENKRMSHFIISIKKYNKEMLTSFIDCYTLKQAKRYVKDMYNQYLNDDNYLITLTVSL